MFSHQTMHHAQYQKLCAIVNESLYAHNKTKIECELYENLTETLYAFPIEKLLCIESDRSFIIEAYYKIADWSIETPLLDDLLGQLNRGDIDREGIISLFESFDEKRLKHTDIIRERCRVGASHHSFDLPTRMSISPQSLVGCSHPTRTPDSSILYIEISSYIASRAYSGIQRVVREFASRLVDDTLAIEYQFIYFDAELFRFVVIPKEEMKLFLQTPREYIFEDESNLLKIEEIGEGDLFLDMDAVWSLGLKRAYLYPKLNSNGVHILNFIHDMIPIVRPYATHHDIVRNFVTFVDALYSYSDMVFFNSRSSQRDFETIQAKIGSERYIPTLVTKLGSSLFSLSKGDRGQALKNQATEWVDFQCLTPIKYILFVGTIEPRKNHALMLEVFEELHQSYDDLYLVFIGIAGWSNDAFIEKLSSHPLLGERLHWYEYVDDYSLMHFYEHAYMVVYLSSYEGFGLPIAESLGYGNITITSKNSSIYEVGKDAADYILYDTPNELSSIITTYLDMPELYRLKRDYIKEHYLLYTWESFYSTIVKAIEGYSIHQPISTPSKLQFVTISYDKELLQRAIASIDRESSAVGSYLIITSIELLESFRSIESLYDIEVLSIDSVVRWDILTSMIDRLPEQFVWFDSGMPSLVLSMGTNNIPSDWGQVMNVSLRSASQNTFDWGQVTNVSFRSASQNICHLTPRGRYRAYYFAELLEWHSHESDYDETLHYTRHILDQKTTELLAYSCDTPQIIDREILREIAQDIVVDSSMVDIMSYYFNRATTLYPYLFEKVSLEILRNSSKASKDCEDTPSLQRVEEYTQYDLIHRVATFRQGDALLLCSHLPYFVTLTAQCSAKIECNYKAIGFEQSSLRLIATQDQKIIASSKLKSDSYYSEGVGVLELSADSLEVGAYDLLIDVMVDDECIYGESSPYMMKLFVDLHSF